MPNPMINLEIKITTSFLITSIINCKILNPSAQKIASIYQFIRIIPIHPKTLKSTKKISLYILTLAKKIWYKYYSNFLNLKCINYIIQYLE